MKTAILCLFMFFSAALINQILAQNAYVVQSNERHSYAELIDPNDAYDITEDSITTKYFNRLPNQIVSAGIVKNVQLPVNFTVTKVVSPTDTTVVNSDTKTLPISAPKEPSGDGDYMEDNLVLLFICIQE